MNATARHGDWPRAVLFDLDGTLIDSAPDLAASVNMLLSRHGLGPLTLQQVTSMIGNGIRKLVERAFTACDRPPDDVTLDIRYLEMIDVYGDNLTVLTRLYPHAAETIEALAEAGKAVAVVTNKPQRATEVILEHFGLTRHLGAAIGGDSGVAKKPAPDMLLAALERLGAQPWDAVMVGDSGADVQAAGAAGIPVILVEGGYTSVAARALGADLVIGNLGELDAALGILKAQALPQ